MSSCRCPNVQIINNNYSECPICLKSFSNVKLPVTLDCNHTICVNCSSLLGQNGIVNLPLLVFHGFEFDKNIYDEIQLSEDGLNTILKLKEIAYLSREQGLSRSIQRKVINLLATLSLNGQIRICKSARLIGERALIELSSQSNYNMQQKLWAAIRGKACQFLGPAMQDETLKLVLLSLENGAELSRKVLLMFVVQKIIVQFPQASKTSIGQVIQILYKAGCFNINKRNESTLLSLKQEFRTYESLRAEHDMQIVKIANDSGIVFSPEQWSSVLYGDINHKSHMQSIIDKTKPDPLVKYQKLLAEFLVKATRLEGENQSLIAIYSHLQFLVQDRENSSDWTIVHKKVESVYQVLKVLIGGLK